jgi:hypothetical protein
MKKVLFFSIVSLFFANQGATLANTSGMSDQDFTQLTCSYLNEISDKREALTEVLTVTESLISNSQKQTLKDLMTDTISVNDFCQGIKL